MRLDAHDHGRLDRLLTGVAQATVLGPRLTALRVLGRHPDTPGVAPFVKAGALLKGATTYADLRAGSDLVARSALDMGLERFKSFLRDADEHLTREGGLVTLARDVTPFVMPDTAPPAAPSAKPGLPAAGEVVLKLVKALAELVFASEALQAYARSTDAALLRGIVQRFGLDPSKPADAAAAIAFAWAEFRGPGVLGLPQAGPALDAAAERVMRAARADPELIARALDGEVDALSTLQAVAQGKVAPGFSGVVRDDEERALVERLVAEKRSEADIQAALDEFRNRKGRPATILLPANPDDLLKEGWVETSHPEATATGHREFRNPATGEEVWFDKGRSGRRGFEAADQYHRVNPASTSKRDANLDGNGNPVPKGSKRSHIIPGAK